MKLASSRPLTYRLAALLALISLALVTQNCDCQSQSEIPETAQKRIQSMARAIPERAGAVGVIGDLKSFRTTSKTLKSSIDDIIPFGKMVERNVHSTFGISLADPKSWRKAGIAPDASLAIADVETRPVLLTYYRDKQAFESHLTDQLETSLGLKGAPTSKTVGDHKMKVMGDEAGKRIAWGYRGRLAVIVFPPTRSTQDGPTVTSTLQSVLKTESKESFAGLDAYKRFRTFASDHHAFVFMDTDNLADRELDRKATTSSMKQSARYLKKNFNGLGGVLEPSSSGLTMRVWLGINAELAETIGTLEESVAAADWTNLATDQTMIGMRFGMHPQKTVEAMLARTPDDQRRALERQLQRMGEAFELNIEKDVLAHLTGEIGFFFYGFGPKLGLTDLQRGNLMKVLRQTGLIAALNFDKAKSLRKIARTMADSTSFLNYRSLETEDGSTVEGIKVVEFTESEDSGAMARLMGGSMGSIPITFYVHDSRLIVSTTAIGETSMRGYLTGSREDASPLANSESLDLGAEFASTETFTGAYFNVVRAHEVLKDKLPPFPAIQRVFTKLQELLISVEPRDRAAVFNLKLDRTSSDKEK